MDTLFIIFIISIYIIFDAILSFIWGVTSSEKNSNNSTLGQIIRAIRLFAGLWLLWFALTSREDLHV